MANTMPFRRGIFAVVKPVGITSAGVTSRIKALLVEEARKSDPVARKLEVKVGHGGTLDRGATGVLVVAIGEDCKKLSTLLNSCDKCYECVGKLGEATDTWDKDGRVIKRAAWEHIKESQISRILTDYFTGEIFQTPPIYSALKYRGKRLSDWAEEGIIVTPKARKITIHSIRLISFQPPFFKITVSCSSGTYIRGIVHELGRNLESAAHVTELCRTKQGSFSLNNALAEHDWTFNNINRLIKFS